MKNKHILPVRYRLKGVPGDINFKQLIEKVANDLDMPPREVYKIVGHYFRKAANIVSNCKGYVVIPYTGQLLPSSKAIAINQRYKQAKRKRLNDQQNNSNKKRFKNKRNRVLVSEEYISLLNYLL